MTTTSCRIPCDRGDQDARCSLCVSNVRLLEGPRSAPGRVGRPTQDRASTRTCRSPRFSRHRRNRVASLNERTRARAPPRPRSLDDVDAAVVNGNYAIEAGLKPSGDALVLESAKDNPYGNFLAVKKGNENDPRVKKLAKLLTSAEVKKFIEDKYDGSVIASF